MAIFIISAKQAKELLEMSDDKITNKLVKLFNIFKHRDKEENTAISFVNRVLQRRKAEDTTDFECKFFDAWVKKAEADLKMDLAKDAVLKKYFVY